MDSKKIRKSVIAGSWYTGDKSELKTQIDGLFENTKIAGIKGHIIAVISPHAGYAYSGYTAANSYKQVYGKTYDAVIILAPSHREAFKGASVYNGDGFETPLGIVPVDQSLATAIVAEDKMIRASMDGHREEHSLEIQLPFLQVAIPDLKIVPIVFWDYAPENCKRLANAILSAVKDKNVLIVASTDLYHGYSYEECVSTNDKTIEKILELKPEELNQGFLDQTYQACGAGPVVVAEMIALELGADEAQLLHRTNSGDVTKQRGGYVVGYSAIALYKKEDMTGSKEKEEDIGIDLGLNEDEKAILLKIARESIEYGVKKLELPAVQTDDYPILKEPRGAFVTLTKNSMLRGCIGYIYAIKPLGETIQEMAQAAAFRDPRFSPVVKDEVPKLEIEISVLTPIREISDIEEIEIGKHGIIIEKGGYSGLLLPQVATEYGWNREVFLGHTCQKAGLPKNTWQDPETIIKIFSADIFHEEK